MEEQAPRYFSYLLRVWQVESDKGVLWRGSLDCVQTGERVYFQTLEGLVEKLAQVIGEPFVHRNTSP
jgi:hypothetical protein